MEQDILLIQTMRARFFLLFGAFALLFGCQNEQFKESPMVDISGGFEVELESILPDAGPETKTFADENHLVLWHSDRWPQCSWR